MRAADIRRIGPDQPQVSNRTSNSVFVRGRYAYLITLAGKGICSASTKTGCELQVYDVSDRTNPTYVGGADNGDNASNGLYVSGRYAYLARDENTGPCSQIEPQGCELLVFDISDPSNPSYVGGVDNGGDNGKNVFVLGRYAYHVKNADDSTCSSSSRDGCELQIYDVSDPSTPAYVGGANLGDKQGRFVSVKGVSAYVAVRAASGPCNTSDNTGCEFQRFDVSDPTGPRFVGGLDNGNNDAKTISLVGRHAFVGGNANTSLTCSSSDPTGCELLAIDITPKRSG